jgi:hypothetical protein
MRTVLTYVAVALPPLILAIVGVTHPMHLTAATAEYWRNLHIAILPIFPLLGFAPWPVIRGRDAFLSWLVGILGFVYAAFYTALDVLAGIGAGGLKLDDMGMATGTLYGLGDNLGFIGSVALIAACAITGLAAYRRAGITTVPGTLVLLVGSYLFLKDHIYFPVGVIGQLCIGIGWSAMLWAQRRAALDGGSRRARPAGAQRAARLCAHSIALQPMPMQSCPITPTGK